MMYRKRIAAGLVLALSAASLLTASAQASHGVPCADVTLVYARGSGQSLNFREAPKFFEKVRSRLGGDIRVNAYELGTEAHGGASYPAVGIGVDSLQAFKNLIESDASVTGGLGGQYRASVRSGVTELTSYLSDRTSRCPAEQVVVGGYSQGAQVVGDALTGLSSSVLGRIAFVPLFGDPKLYLPEGRGPFPPACRGKEFSTWRRGNVSCFTDNGILEARNPYLPSAIASRSGSWCDRNDPICNNNLADFAVSAHSDYASDGAEMDDAAQEVAEKLEARMPDRADDIDTSVIIIGVGTAGVDVAFVIDSTGSMAGRIGSAVSVADVVGSKIVAIRGRVALTEYRDAGDDPVAAVRVPLTTNLDTFRNGLGGLRASGGGDTPEALLAALTTTLNGLDWKPGATKAAVVLTDAGYHDPDVATGATLADVAARALAIDPVNVYPVVPAALADVYRPIADGTSGQVVIDTGNTASALTEAIERIELRPVALLTIDEFFARPGDDVTFDASRSYDPDSTISAYEWDFDGNGSIDASTTTPTTTTTYSSPFDGIAQVRLRSADGGVANATANVHIDTDGLTSEIPGTPRRLVATPRTRTDEVRTVALDWEPPAGGGQVDGWTVTDVENNVLARLGASATRVSINDVPLATPSTFRVVASNRFGPGEPATVTVAAVEQPASSTTTTLKPVTPTSTTTSTIAAALGSTSKGPGPPAARPRGPLPTTGAPLALLAGISVWLLVSGVATSWMSNRSRRRAHRRPTDGQRRTRRTSAPRENIRPTPTSSSRTYAVPGQGLRVSISLLVVGATIMWAASRSTRSPRRHS